MSSTPRVLLAYMPFGALRVPSLGVSLLKACLAQRDIACDVRYLNITFAERFGLVPYECVARLPGRCLVCERKSPRQGR